MSSEYITIPCYSLGPRSLTLYESVENLNGFSNSAKGWENLNDNANKYGELSEHARKRLKRALNYMLYLTKERQVSGSRTITKSQNFTTNYEKGEKYMKSVKFKLTFITLTLPAKQMHSDVEIKSKCLNSFLNDLRRKFKVDMYVWKAEKQENGNIHFHILTNKFIHHQKIRTSWNQILLKLGYISAYQKSMETFFQSGFRMSTNPNDKRSEAAQRKAFEKGKTEGWQNPNSTDIHALYKVRNAAAYLSKYLAKSVTKSERINQIKTLRNEKEENQKRITEIEARLFLYDETNKEGQRLANELRKRVQRNEDIERTLESLVQLGVQGRIWGCSSKLSKCSNFSTSENWSDIPGIEEMETKSAGKFTTDIGNRRITTFAINISDFPALKANLDFHLQKSLNPETNQLL